MLTNYFPEPSGLHRVQSTPAAPYLGGFAVALMGAGYRSATIQAHLRAAAHLSSWQRRHGQVLTQLNEESIAGFKRHLRACQCDGFGRASQRHSAGAQLFLRYLRDAAVIPAARGVIDPPLFVGFCDWMQQHRGVTETTLQCYGRIIIDALQTLGDNPAHFEAAGLRAFVLDRAGRHGRSKAKLVVTALRMFVRYLIAQGQCRAGLDTAIPTVAGWRLAALPRYLPAAEVERIIAACDPTTRVGARDRAILLLLSRLGLRGGDIVALRLVDIDWAQATVQVSGKSRRLVRLPLPQEAGDALLHYLTQARPAVDTDQVFLRVTTPIGPLAKAGTVSDIVKRAIGRAGVSTPTCGAHLLRHSAATALLAEGASLESIGVLLRHQSLDTTAHYAKVHLKLLAQLAQPWPEVSPC